MTEADWLKAKDPDAMLRVVAERLTPRRWHLLACCGRPPDRGGRPGRRAVLAGRRVRRTEPGQGPVVGPGEKAPGGRPQGDPGGRRRGPGGPTADRRPGRPGRRPDRVPGDVRPEDQPERPLFRSASLHAATAIRLAGEAAEQGAGAVALLIAERPGSNHLARVREAVVEATRLRSAASIYANAALDLKVRGDDAADRNTGKNVNVQLAAAQDTVTRSDEHLGYKTNDLREAREKADRKAVGRFLHELVGNPFTPYRFDPAWRTETVVEVARGIYQDRAFDRMPILADALLDADCDEEAVLRHCRGTEAHTPDGATHCRGCWVLELILEHEPALFTAAPVRAPKPPAQSAAGGRARPAPPDGILRLLEAMSQDANLDGDDEE